MATTAIAEDVIVVPADRQPSGFFMEPDGRTLALALDFDDTFTADPEFWTSFVKMARSRGHVVTVVTARYERENREVVQYLGEMFEQGDAPEVIYTGRKLKRDYCISIGKPMDIWIDDAPAFADSAPLTHLALRGGIPLCSRNDAIKSGVSISPFPSSIAPPHFDSIMCRRFANIILEINASGWVIASLSPTWRHGAVVELIVPTWALSVLTPLLLNVAREIQSSYNASNNDGPQEAWLEMATRMTDDGSYVKIEASFAGRGPTMSVNAWEMASQRIWKELRK